MPELPEVTTTVNGLNRAISGLCFIDVWTDLDKANPIKQFKDTIKDPAFLKNFRKNILGVKIKNVERRGKNILINLSNNKIILIHLKMTGHLMVGYYDYDRKVNKWYPNKNQKGALHDPYNRFIHVAFSLSNKKHLVMCDSRKFGKITMIDKSELNNTPHLKDLGPEPLNKYFDFLKFKKSLESKPQKRIKSVLMNQSVIVGIGNIYSDEMLWLSNIHPESKVGKIPSKNLKLLFNSMKLVLKKGINLGGDSMSDYRNIDGEKGSFQEHHNVYQKNKKSCSKKGCRGVIIRKVIDGRSAHFCNNHQKLFD